MPFSKRKMASGALFCGVLLLLSQAAYFLFIFQSSRRPPVPECDGVLAYGGLPWRFSAAFQRAQSLHRPLYLSGAPSEIEGSGIKPLASPIQVTLDSKAYTTDQNARHAAAYLRSNGVHRVELVTSWFHMPRALFLTRMYLWGTPVEVDPYWAEPIPAGWWKVGYFWIEWVKFWGSLVRVFFAEFGWESRRHYLEIGGEAGITPFCFFQKNSAEFV
jgi:uncharacterized SAM-binding protein YcdF (DUF218 family)